MTDESKTIIDEPVPAAEESESPPAAPEPPEPWTPERAADWNRYYDRYVALGVVLLAFMASANRIHHASIWTHLRVGSLIASAGGPLKADPLSVAGASQRWVDIPWLFQWGGFSAFRLASDLAPTAAVAGNAGPDISATPRGDQFGAGTLIALTALGRVAVALLLMWGLCRPGPGMWWAAICTAVAVGVAYGPAGVSLGGLAEPAAVTPDSWGQLLLAVELILIHRAIDLGRPALLLGAVPVVALWANVDESFLFGVAILWATALGLVAARNRKGLGMAATAAVLGTLAAMLNPATYRIYPAALEIWSGLFSKQEAPLTTDQISVFGGELRKLFGSETNWVIGYYAAAVGLGLASFAVNYRRFSPPRLLAFAVASAAWATFYFRYPGEFALVWAATLILNGQEWYLGAFGAEGRVAKSWQGFSVGGRALTIVLVFAAVTRAVMGWGANNVNKFGFGFDPEEFGFESAAFLKTAGFAGNVFNTRVDQGDALNWVGYPSRRPYLDSRRHLFDDAARAKHHRLQLDLREDKVDAWGPAFDADGITAVMLNEETSPRTYQAMSRSPNWVPFYDDGSVILFGRVDAKSPPADVAFFRGEALQPGPRAFGPVARPAPTAEMPPSAKDWIGNLLDSSGPVRAQPHAEAARRWLQPVDVPEGSAFVPEPSRCILAVRECRAALAKNTNDTSAYRMLATAYRGLMLQESAMIAGIAITPENAARIARVPVDPRVLQARYRQRVAALNYAILTTRTPATTPARSELASLNLQLGDAFAEMGFADLARDRYRAALEVDLTKQLDPQYRIQLSQQVKQLDERYEKGLKDLNDLAIQQQLGPLQRANFALSQGLPGVAIRELEEADQTGVGTGTIKPLLLDLYCQTGQPDRGLELLSASAIDDPALSTGPGTAAYRNGLVSMLLGIYSHGIFCWDKNAIRAARQEQVMNALSSSNSTVRGDAKYALNGFVELPGKVSNQASWEFELGLLMLESGVDSREAAAHLANCLALEPDYVQKAVIEYYLDQIRSLAPPEAAKPAEPAPPAEPAR